MPSGPLSQELGAARDFSMAKREYRRLLVGSLHREWHRQKMGTALCDIPNGPKAVSGGKKIIRHSDGTSSKFDPTLRRFRNFTKGIQQYSTFKYKMMNALLRGTKLEREEDEEPTRKSVHAATTALKIGLRWTNLCESSLKMKLVGDGGQMLFRGSGSIPSVSLHVGGTFTDNAFFSTSLKQSVAENFLNTMRPGEEKILFQVVKHSTGIDISKNSGNKHEAEVLFAPDTMFRIISVNMEQTVGTVEGPVKVVVMEEMA